MPAAFAQAQAPARQVLDDCIESSDDEFPGLAGLEITCPGLKAALDELGVMPLLSEVQRGELDRNGLSDLQALLQRYEQQPETGPAIDVDSVKAVLGSLREPVQAEQSLSWYERFKRWLRNAIDRKASESNPWLSRWLDDHSMSDTVRLVLIYGVLILVVLLAFVIIINEARAARASGRRTVFAGSDQAGARGELQGGLGDLDSAPLADRPSLLLRMLVATLVKAGRLQSERSLTHQELTRRARFDDSAQQECFHRVAELAERVVYGGGDNVTADDLDDVVRAGRTLHAQLTGAAT